MNDREKWLDQLLLDNNRTLQPYERQAVMWALYNIDKAERVDIEIEDYRFRGGFRRTSLGWGHPYETWAWGFEASNWSANDDPEPQDGKDFVFHLSYTEDAHESRIGMIFEFSGYGIIDDEQKHLSDFAALLQKNMFTTSY